MLYFGFDQRKDWTLTYLQLPVRCSILRTAVRLLYLNIGSDFWVAITKVGDCDPFHVNCSFCCCWIALEPNVCSGIWNTESSKVTNKCLVTCELTALFAPLMLANLARERQAHHKYPNMVTLQQNPYYSPEIVKNNGQNQFFWACKIEHPQLRGYTYKVVKIRKCQPP